MAGKTAPGAGVDPSVDAVKIKNASK